MINKNKIKNKIIKVLREDYSFQTFFDYIHIPCRIIFQQGFLYIKTNKQKLFCI